MIKFRESSKRMHCRISTAPGWSNDRILCKVEVPIEENDITTVWRTVSDPQELQELLV